MGPTGAGVVATTKPGHPQPKEKALRIFPCITVHTGWAVVHWAALKREEDKHRDENRSMSYLSVVDTSRITGESGSTNGCAEPTFASALIPSSGNSWDWRSNHVGFTFPAKIQRAAVLTRWVPFVPSETGQTKRARKCSITLTGTLFVKTSWMGDSEKRN